MKQILKVEDINSIENLIKKYGILLAGARVKEAHKIVLDLVEKPLIEALLEKTDGNQSKTASILGINRNTLHAKIKRFKITVDRYKFSY